MSKHLLPANFRVEIGGLPAGYFTEIAGIGSENEVSPASAKFGDITLKKGYLNTDPLSHKVNPGALSHKVNPAMHKVNPGAAMQKVNPVMHKVNPAMHKVNPAMHKVNPVIHKVNPALHKVNPGDAAHKVNPVMHKVTPGAEIEMRSAGRLLLRGFVLDESNKHLLQHWVNPAAAKTPTPQGHIVMLDEEGRPVRRWQFYEAWPCKWHVPEADGSTSVELAVSKLLRA